MNQVPPLYVSFVIVTAHDDIAGRIDDQLVQIITWYTLARTIGFECIVGSKLIIVLVG